MKADKKILILSILCIVLLIGTLALLKAIKNNTCAYNYSDSKISHPNSEDNNLNVDDNPDDDDNNNSNNDDDLEDDNTDDYEDDNNFELLDIQSSPIVQGIWKVRFNTTGAANL